mmetsp:Transcript_16416/g.33841  ORF Transcript_16416/g.33841 Transcript_16416/m.33841 type:complete len:489 (+) Transcript_16416:102-1568(+)
MSNSSPATRQNRTYTLFGIRQLAFTMNDPVDWIIGNCATFAEFFILVLGPLLICFASVIIGGLTWVFFTIYLPMLQFDLDQKEASSLRRFVEVGAHIAFVVFVLTEIIFNYYMCVTTRNAGPRSSFDKVVRELAESTNVDYPNTPQEVARFQRDFSDKITIRLRRRRAREAEERERQIAHASCCDSNGNCSSVPEKISTAPGTSGSLGHDEENITLRKNTRQQKPAAKKKNEKAPPRAPVRSWQLMAPDEWGFCSKTKQAKPPRSHYDNVSKTLVLCLDHYCPWMFNAIGYFNYRYFVNFLVFVFVAMMYGAAITYRPFVNSTGPLYREQLKMFRSKGVWTRIHSYTPISSERMPLSLGFMLCLAVGIAVGCLGGFHMWLVFTGQTTIEFHGNWVMRSRAKKAGQKYRNPYDMGYKRNWQQVYGEYSGKWSMFLALIIPSTREPEFLPLPIPGEEGKRKHMRKRIREEETEMTKALISSQPSTPATIV